MTLLYEDDFYAPDGKGLVRLRSTEKDFGADWMDANTHRYRVSFIDATGEVYALRMTDLMFEVLAEDVALVDVERWLEGWAAICGGPNSLSWVRERLNERSG